MKQVESITNATKSTDSDGGGGPGEVQGRGVERPEAAVGLPPGSDKTGMGAGPGKEASAFMKPLGPSITLHGCGDRSGRDVNNSMGLGEAYRWVCL